MVQWATLPQNTEFKLKKEKNPIWQLPAPTKRNHNKNSTNSSKGKKKWQFNLGACAYILIIFFFEAMVALSKNLNVGLSNIFSCGMSLTEIQTQAHCNFPA